MTVKGSQVSLARKELSALLETLTEGYLDQSSNEPVLGFVYNAIDISSTVLEKSKFNPGLQYTFYLLTKIARFTRRQELLEFLFPRATSLEEKSTVFDITAAFQSRVDSYIKRKHHPTVISETAQEAAGEALIHYLCGNGHRPLFEKMVIDNQHTGENLSSPETTAKLDQDFFSSYLTKTFTIICDHGSGKSAITSFFAETLRFNKRLEKDCQQWVRVFFSSNDDEITKIQPKGEITQRKTSRYLSVILDKMAKELTMQRSDQ